MVTKKFSPGIFPGIKPVFILFLLIPFGIKAQNLVPNGDFEYYTQCPNDYGQVSYAVPWYLPSNGSSDYYNECVTAPGASLYVDVPSNSFGYQYAHSGKGYCGIGKSDIDIVYFEYLASKLSIQLETNKEYCFELWLSTSDTMCTYFDKLGVYFDQDSIHTNSNFLNLSPQILFEGFMTDKVNWVKYESSFVASGGEQFLCIGLFDTTGVDSLITCNDIFSKSGEYFFIDDVSLIECTELNLVIPNIFSPNNDKVNDNWFVQSAFTMNVRIFNRWGNIVFEEYGKQPVWDGSNCTEGVYFYQIEINENIKTGFIQLIR